MLEDPILLSLVGLGLLLNFLSIKPLKHVTLRKWIKMITGAFLVLGFFVFLFVLIIQSSTPITHFLFYLAMFLWNFGFFEIFFILLIKPKKHINTSYPSK